MNSMQMQLRGDSEEVAQHISRDFPIPTGLKSIWKWENEERRSYNLYQCVTWAFLSLRVLECEEKGFFYVHADVFYFESGFDSVFQEISVS